MGWFLVEVMGYKSVDRVRLQVNAKKDDVEESCMQSANGLIKRTRTLAVFVARRVRAKTTDTKDEDGDGIEDGTDKPLTLKPWERAMLKRVDDAGYSPHSTDARECIRDPEPGPLHFPFVR